VTAQQRTSVPDPITRALLGWQPARVLMTANRLNVFNVLGEDQQMNSLELAFNRGIIASIGNLATLCLDLQMMRRQIQEGA